MDRLVAAHRDLCAKVDHALKSDLALELLVEQTMSFSGVSASKNLLRTNLSAFIDT